MSGYNGFEIFLDPKTGILEFQWANGAKISNIYSAVQLGGILLRTLDADEHEVQFSSLPEAHQKYGKGVEWVIQHRSFGKPLLTQIITAYENTSFCFMRLEVKGGTPEEILSTNYMAPLITISSAELHDSVLKLNTGDQSEIQVLLIPFDNDKWVRYQSVTMPNELESYELTSIYDPQSRNGFVLGSVKHDVWKTGVKIQGTDRGKIGEIEIYGGAAGEYTRDTIPHGNITGNKLTAPMLFIGYYDDYRLGLSEYGNANAELIPAMPWHDGVPFGWNSWSAAGDKLDYAQYVHTSEFIKTQLQDNYFHNNGNVYINFDAFSDNLSKDEFFQAVNTVRKNGQKPGIYWTPFTFWGKDHDRLVEGTDGKYRYRDILLRDRNGNILPELDGGLAIDPTHPANLLRADYHLDHFIDWGFEYIKLDFLGHGALEGKHADSQIETGIQAYNWGMSYIREKLDPIRIGRPFFISLSIAPLFPHQYAHSRRISCDAFGTLEDTEYMLNGLTYGWWINNSLYRYNDPDHTVLYKSYNQRATSWHEGRSRLNASIIAGTVLLLGDDFRIEEAQKRAIHWATNAELLALAQKGDSFILLESKFGGQAANIFFLNDDLNGYLYLAIFNFSLSESAIIPISLQRLAVQNEQSYRIYDLWDKTDYPGKGDLVVELKASESKIVRLQFS
ncbi:alpha-galactosidase [Paenibacillus psychroresistens]|uniref:Alpha-galactosidase n=1 Tax=Paenibacillus psychroresistens TaxID=1778678 RepID=A0A6B8RFH3_9BACL|nr:alpha-galactosidase [Paenibacillus psychroresistens]QGQ94687.1 alpha-galactosidase [Paenibacillus psychroresistens]